VRRFKLRPVTLSGLARLSRTACSDVTGGHAVQAGWAINRITAYGTTRQLHHTTRRDSRLRGTMSLIGHVRAP
jgi:hypothetical protein